MNGFEALATSEVHETHATDQSFASLMKTRQSYLSPRRRTAARAKATAAKAAAKSNIAIAEGKALKAEMKSKKTNKDLIPQTIFNSGANEDTPPSPTTSGKLSNAKTSITLFPTIPREPESPQFGPVLAQCLIPGCLMMAQHEGRRFQRFENALPAHIKSLQAKKSMTSREWEEMERFFRVHEKRSKQLRAAKMKASREGGA